MEPAATTMAAVTTGITNLFAVVSTAFTEITGNEVLVLFLAAGVVTTGLGIFRSMKSSVR